MQVKINESASGQLNFVDPSIFLFKANFINNYLSLWLGYETKEKASFHGWTIVVAINRWFRL
jgi:hypothetical protein